MQKEFKFTFDDIVNEEYKDFNLSPSEFLKKIVNKEFQKYSIKLLNFASKHTYEECLELIDKWWNTYKICDTTERLLNDFFKKLYDLSSKTNNKVS